jgi:hypothetical protein
MRNSHYSVVCPTVLSCVPLLCRGIHYSAWVLLLCRAFHLFNSLYVNLVCVNKLLKSQTGLALCYSVWRVGFPIDPFDISNQASLVGLSEAHDINHKSLFLYSSKAYKTVVKGLGIRNLNQRQVDL